jgi:hypothetical protein
LFEQRFATSFDVLRKHERGAFVPVDQSSEAFFAPDQWNLPKIAAIDRKRRTLADRDDVEAR